MMFKTLRQWNRHLRLEILRPIRIRRAARLRAGSSTCFLGVTGSSGKSTTTALIGAILRTQGKVKSQVMDNTINPLIHTVTRNLQADYVVAELGVGRKNQMAEMAGLLQPDIAIVTLVGLEHYSAFRSREAIAQEKGHLVAAVKPEGLAVLNSDDPLVLGMAALTTARTVTFGWAEAADCRILATTGAFPAGVTVRLGWRGQPFDIRTRFLGAHFAVPVAAAVAATIGQGVPLSVIIHTIEKFEPLHLRLSAHAVPAGPVFLADCAKAPLGTLQLAFDALHNATAPRKRIVLGTISDYSGSRRRIYKKAAQAALAVADELIVITGQFSDSWINPTDLSSGRCRSFADTGEAALYIAQTATPGEVILLKGSQNFHLERIYLNMLEQVRCWITDCKYMSGCFSCALYGHDPAQHKRLLRQRRWRSKWLGQTVPPGLRTR